MTLLECLALKHNTDKISHGYCPYYERFIGDMRLLPLTMIELGVADGSSLRMWREWMPEARVIGFDQNGYSRPGDEITVFKGDQSNVEDLKLMVETIGRFHFVVDDASHHPKDQKVSFDFLWDKLVSGGWYAIEDLQDGACREIASEQSVDSLILGNGSVEELHLMGKQGGGSGILFLKKR